MSVGDLNALTAIGRRGEEPNARAREDPPQGRKPDGENGWAAFNPSRFEHNVFSVIGGIAIRPSTAAAPTDALGTARLRSGRGARRPKRRADDAARERKLAGGIESVSKPKRYVRRFVRPSLQQPDLDAGGRERGPSGKNRARAVVGRYLGYGGPNGSMRFFRSPSDRREWLLRGTVPELNARRSAAPLRRW